MKNPTLSERFKTIFNFREVYRCKGENLFDFCG